ncbi:hypothetical protein GCM10022285_44780 [Streptomyces tunisiensis]|uniref:Uncharacterized protein n=1 Tax=Streptomyces tunisiensis TaxID=948699 RepID=A0ABP7YX84_9ACTN
MSETPVESQLTRMEEKGVLETRINRDRARLINGGAPLETDDKGPVAVVRLQHCPPQLPVRPRWEKHCPVEGSIRTTRTAGWVRLLRIDPKTSRACATAE